MKVLVITTWFPGDHNPSEAPFNLDHVRALQHAGHTVRVLHIRLSNDKSREVGFDQARSAVWQGVPVRRMFLSPYRPFSAMLNQLTLFREMAWPDLIHTMAFSSILTVMVPWLARCTTAREPAWVHTEHWTGALDPASVSPLWKRLSWLRRVYVLPHQVTGVGKALVEAVRPFARPGAVTVVPCVVRCVAGPSEPKFGSPVRLVAVGAVAQRKRPFAAIDTIEWLHERGRAAQLTWVGDGPLRLACQKRLGEKGLEQSVQFVGAVQPDQVPMYLQAADLFLLPSSHETFFASAAEAIGAGRGVVICRIPGLGDFLTEENSILVEDASAETLGTAVLEASLRFRNVEAKQMASSIRQNYSVEAVSAKFSSVYTAALARA